MSASTVLHVRLQCACSATESGDMQVISWHLVACPWAVRYATVTRPMPVDTDLVCPPRLRLLPPLLKWCEST
jgi:hypothetical protein